MTDDDENGFQKLLSEGERESVVSGILGAQDVNAREGSHGRSFAIHSHRGRKYPGSRASESESRRPCGAMEGGVQRR